jgi:hypothetical protein
MAPGDITPAENLLLGLLGRAKQYCEHFSRPFR